MFTNDPYPTTTRHVAYIPTRVGAGEHRANATIIGGVIRALAVGDTARALAIAGEGVRLGRTEFEGTVRRLEARAMNAVRAPSGYSQTTGK